jgi:hypothetical protein
MRRLSPRKPSIFAHAVIAADLPGRSWRGVALAACALAAALVISLAASGSARAQGSALATCFWEGPISTKQPSSRGFDGRNFNFPEESATYWLARFNLPSGTKLVLKGQYAHGRYESLNAYTDGAPTDALSDFETRPDPGSTNPFIAGDRRDLPNRSYSATVLDASPPADPGARSPNTLYAHPDAGKPIELLYRVYEPDRGLDLAGGTGLPHPELVHADGTVSRDDAACQEINDPDRSIPVQTTPAPEWQAAVRTPGCDPDTNPAYNPTRWERFFSLDYASLAVISDCTEQGRAARRGMAVQPKGGLYSNRDNAYVYAHLSRRFGPLLVVRAKLPTVPATYDGEKTMGSGQLRFWSLCTGESRVTTRTPGCISDRQLPIDRDRMYTVVVSRAADRPANATRGCGVGWVDWGLRGDAAGRPDYGLLIMRNMLPATSFAQAIQNVQKPGTEPQVMGGYFPSSAYSSKSQFEGRGCPSSRLSLRGRRLRVRRRGRRVRLRVDFASSESACTGRVRISARRRGGRRGRTLGRTSFSVAGGASRRVTVRLTRAGRRALRRRRKLRVIVVARGRTSWDNVVSARRTYRLSTTR